MTIEKSTGAREEFVKFFGGHDVLHGALALPFSLPSERKVPAVIVAHGFGGSASQRKFVEMSRVFAENDIAFFRFDHSGCGESCGSSINMGVSKWASEFSRAYDFLCGRKEIDSGRIGFLGYSLGAVVVCLYMTNSKIAIPANALVLVAPALDQKGLMKLWRIPAEMEKWEKQGYLDTPRGRVGSQYLYEVKDYTYLASEIRVPTLVIRGGKDKDVPARFTKKVFDTLSCEKVLVTIAGVDHGFESYPAKKQLTARSLTWFQNHL